MTRRSSVRAQARRNYHELKQTAAADAAAPQEAAPTPDPSPRVASARGGGENNPLMARVRALYEDSAVPVREIAAIAGVSERTLYTYVAKHDWKRRYRVLPGSRRSIRPAASAPLPTVTPPRNAPPRRSLRRKTSACTTSEWRCGASSTRSWTSSCTISRNPAARPSDRRRPMSCATCTCVTSRGQAAYWRNSDRSGTHGLSRYP
jgi:hypothetical protein